MRLLHVVRQFHPSVGGIENAVLGLCRALRDQGHECAVVTLRTVFNSGEQAPARESVDGLPVFRLSHIGPRRYPVAPGVLAYLRTGDVVHIHAIDFFVDFLSLTRGWHRRPLVVNTHGGIFHTRWNLRFKQLWFQTITRWSLGGAAAVICDSRHDEALFRPIVPARKLRVIPNGVDLAPFQTLAKAPVPGLLLGIGRLAENKGLDRIIPLLADAPEARLVWIGEDVEGRGPSLLALAQAHGVAERVQLLGRVPSAEMAAWLARAWAFVSAARYEAFGISTLEAMSSGTVPLVTPVGVHPEVVQDGQTGFLWRFEQAGEAGPVLRRVLALPVPELTRLGEAARRTAAAFAWERVAQDYLAVYQAVRAGAC